MAILQSFNPPVEHTTTDIFHLFPKLPLELRVMIWQKAADQQGMFTCGTVKSTRVSSDRSKNYYQCIDGPEHILHSPIPSLVHASRESRNLTLTSIEFQEGRLLNTWDKFIVLAGGPYPSGMSPCYRHTRLGSEWYQFQDIVYFAPDLCYGAATILLARVYGQHLQIMFRPRAGGRCVKKISVLTPEEIKGEMWESFKQGWSERFGNEDEEIPENKFPEPELICISNIDTVLQVKSAIRKSGILHE
ncbi:hypothetical protein V501_02382 [Pseudogymnoascus sp. VKM F-4519 (FW-2642)]|nr:hypothetical protein V501_02382 [Pseudogymnoascus sp. VKM F-4519 (FW-2642)]